jgi:hypothetical protein
LNFELSNIESRETSYQTAPLIKYNSNLQRRAADLFQRIAHRVGVGRAKQYKGSFSIFATTSQATAAKVVIHEAGKGKMNGDALAELSRASAFEVPEWPVATCKPWKTGNQLLASDTKSIGQEASTNMNWSWPLPFPHREAVPMFTPLGVPKLPQVMRKSGLVAVGGFWQLP